MERPSIFYLFLFFCCLEERGIFIPAFICISLSSSPVPCPPFSALSHLHPTTPLPQSWNHANTDIRYPSTIAKSLPPNWAIAEVLLSSSYRGWGTSSLQKDAKELAECVGYFCKLRPGREVVLMGHSTGCQDVMEYVVGEGEFCSSFFGVGFQGSCSELLRHVIRSARCVDDFCYMREKRKERQRESVPRPILHHHRPHHQHV